RLPEQGYGALPEPGTPAGPSDVLRGRSAVLGDGIGPNVTVPRDSVHNRPGRDRDDPSRPRCARVHGLDGPDERARGRDALRADTGSRPGQWRGDDPGRSATGTACCGAARAG